MAFNKPKETHPSWGRISIHRVSGGTRALFASSIRHDHTIRITIERASLRRDLHNDWISGEDELIEIELSPVQFAEALTSMNTSGTPCTILHVNMEQMPRCEFVDKKQQAKDEFKEKIVGIAGCMDEMGAALDELKGAKSIKKSDLERISAMFSRVRADIASNMPFAAECFDEQVERTVMEAKGEIEAHMLHKALRMAQEGLNLVKQLNDPEDRPRLSIE